MERPLDFNTMFQIYLSSEMRHLIIPPNTFDEAKENVIYSSDRFVGFLNEKNLRDTTNYLFLLNHPSMVEKYAGVKEKIEGFCRLRKVAITGLSLYDLIRVSIPTTEGIQEWDELEKVKSLSEYLSRGYSSSFENLKIADIAKKDDSLLDFLCQEIK